MSRWIKTGLYVLLITVVVLFALAIVFGRKFLVVNESVNPTNAGQVILKKQDEKGQILKAQVAKYDATSLTVIIEGEGEMSFSNLAEVSVWTIKDGVKGEVPKKADWSKVAAGKRVSLSMDKSGQKLISVIVML